MTITHVQFLTLPDAAPKGAQPGVVLTDQRHTTDFGNVPR